MPAAQIPLDGPGGSRESPRPQQRGGLDVDERDVQGFGDGLPKGAEDPQADQPIGTSAGLVGIDGHLLHHRGDHRPNGSHRPDWVAPAGFHEGLPGIAGHDLLNIAAQGEKSIS